MKESAEESGSARNRSLLARIHLSISALAMSVERPRRPAEIAGAVDQRLRPSLHVFVARVRNTHRMRQNARRKWSGESGKEIDHLSPRQAIKIHCGQFRIQRCPDGFDRFRHQGRHHGHALGPVLVVVLAHQCTREKGALHRRVRIVGTEQSRVVLYVFGVSSLGKEGAAYGFDPQYGCFVPQAPVDRVGIAGEVGDRNGFVQGGQGRGRHGVIL